MSFLLGINTCFAVKRWPRADEWSAIVRDDLGLDLVQHSLDLVDLGAGSDAIHDQAGEARAACVRRGVTIHSTFTGLVAYSSNLLLAPDGGARRRALDWYERAIRYTALAGARSVGGHLGSFTVGDHADPRRRSELWTELRTSLEHLRRAARAAGLDALLVENMASAREPSRMAEMEELLCGGDATRVPVSLCLDVGHQCVPGTTGEERDPYAWLRRLGGRAAVVHLQQTDAAADHHWPFTRRHDAAGRIVPARVLEALGPARPVLILEVIPAFETDDREVLDDLRETVDCWRAALADHAAAAGKVGS